MTKAEKTIFSALVALAAADGPISPEERAWLHEVLEEAGIKRGVSLEHPQPVDRELLRSAVRTREDRLDFLKFGLLVAMADGSVSAAEHDFLKELAQDLDVSEAELEDLRHNTVLAIEPGD